MDEQRKMCPNRPEFVVPWAGKLLICCETHARALRAIGNVIGSPVDVRPIVTLEPCYSVDDLAQFKAAQAETKEST